MSLLGVDVKYHEIVVIKAFTCSVNAVLLVENAWCDEEQRTDTLTQLLDSLDDSGNVPDTVITNAIHYRVEETQFEKLDDDVIEKVVRMIDKSRKSRVYIITEVKDHAK